MTRDVRSPLVQVPPLHTPVDDAVARDAELTAMDHDALVAGIDRLRRDQAAVVLAHNYQVPEIQDLADAVGDSLELARQAAAADATTIVLCGVRFMAETAAILCPHKRVLLPDPGAGCSLAESATAVEVRRWREAYPGAVVVAYVNTSAEVKAEADWCCTSANAAAVVAAIPEDHEVLFLPDRFLGLHVERVTGRRLRLWPGACHVHAALRHEELDLALEAHPDAHLLLHPESGAIGGSPHGRGEDGRTLVLGTGAMVRHARECGAPVELVGTEIGMLHRLRREQPATRFVPVRDDAVCSYMKTITLPKLYRSLRDGVHEVRVPDDVAARARVPIERMLALS